MKKYNNIAKGIGALFIITMILGMIDAYTVAPLLKTPLSNFAANSGKFFTGAFSILFMAVGVTGIAILFYPVISRTSKLTAITYLSARIMECLLLITGVVAYLLLINLSGAFTSAGMPEGSHFQTLSAMAIEARYGTYQLAMIILSLASLFLCTSMFRTKIIPRFISVTGFAGYLLVFISAVLDILGIIDTTGAGGILYVPGAIFELLLLPPWLIFKGFNVEDAGVNL